jgi:hypothetical protein
MKLVTSSFCEHKSAGNQRLASHLGIGTTILVPGASCSCLGCSSCSSAAMVSPTQSK